MTVFIRMTTDQRTIPCDLEDRWAGPMESACFLLGGGPSLAAQPLEEIAAAPVPRMAINLAGARLIRPQFWTSYDPTARFHRSIYLDPSVTKFVHKRRAMDLVPETTFKVCECPNTYFFERDGQRGFDDLLRDRSAGIVDWQDSFVQGIDILYRLGFRTIYLAGTELRVRPSVEQIEAARGVGVEYDPHSLLGDFVKQCAAKGFSRAHLEQLPSGKQYHFGERKPLGAAIATDFHYFRVVQYLRLSRRALGLAGLRLVSVTPESRLNAFFPYRDTSEVLAEIRERAGDPAMEPVVGVYTGTLERPVPREPMRDFRPHHWGKGVPKGAPVPLVEDVPVPRGVEDPALRQEAARSVLRHIDAELAEVVEEGADGG
jgi:hypothetical protein